MQLKTLVLLPAIVVAGTTLADTPDACHLFQTETEFVTQTLHMQMEDTRHVLKIPTIYFEDRIDRVEGGEHNAQLFRVMVEDFSPVTRRQSGELRKEGNRAYYNFVLHDPVDLDITLGIAAQSMATGDARVMDAYETQPSDFGLDILLPKSGAQTHRDVFIAVDRSNSLSAVINCSNGVGEINSRCNHDLRTDEIDVRINYPREYLPRWNDLQSSVRDFTSCALNH